MAELLGELDVLALDCQAGGATPAHGDLLEIGWTVCGAAGPAEAVRSRWIVPRTNRRVPRAVRELTGWSEACLDEAIEEAAAWAEVQKDVLRIRASAANVPTVIHFARFELTFLRDLHARLGRGEQFPFDAICLHAVAARLFPDLPRRNIRALAGYLGHSPALMRRSAGHVEATAFIWRALLPNLEQAGVRSWSELKAWLDTPAPSVKRGRRVYPLARELRLKLRDGPGVYRFLRRNGDILYVGKATSLKKRVAGHFKASGPATERGLELLTQVHDIGCTETPSLLEAALLESDEIKRLDPPYNVQLRSGDRSAWFASRDLSEAVPVPDAAHPIGPLPSRRALSAFAALIALAEGAEASRRLLSEALAVPSAFLPDPALFLEGFATFAAELLSGPESSALRRVQQASRALWLLRGRAELESPRDDAAPDAWDLDRVRRRLERALIQGGLYIRRARWLCLLADASVTYREPEMSGARTLVIAAGAIVERRDLERVALGAELSVNRPRSRRERQRAFDAAAYDRMRVLLTELRRVQDDGGEVLVRVGPHVLGPQQLVKLLRAV
jgi:DNA polymerase III subunit epsilon